MPAGEAGELWVKGPQVMAGYFEKPEETANAITADGWFRTGDIAVMNEDGSFKIVDRLKDMIIVSGQKVFPNEVEDVLVLHPKVREAAVIGVPDKNFGEGVCAFIVPSDPSLTVEDVRALCGKNWRATKSRAGSSLSANCRSRALARSCGASCAPTGSLQRRERELGRIWLCDRLPNEFSSLLM